MDSSTARITLPPGVDPARVQVTGGDVQPQPDGSLRGTWHTDISEGPCRGTVLMPVAAFPA